MEISWYTEIVKYCWIGMGAIIMPGVTLGDFTIGTSIYLPTLDTLKLSLGI